MYRLSCPMRAGLINAYRLNIHLGTRNLDSSRDRKFPDGQEVAHTRMGSRQLESFTPRFVASVLGRDSEFLYHVGTASEKQMLIHASGALET